MIKRDLIPVRLFPILARPGPGCPKARSQSHVCARALRIPRARGLLKCAVRDMRQAGILWLGGGQHKRDQSANQNVKMVPIDLVPISRSRTVITSSDEPGLWIQRRTRPRQQEARIGLFSVPQHLRLRTCTRVRSSLVLLCG